MGYQSEQDHCGAGASVSLLVRSVTRSLLMCFWCTLSRASRMVYVGERECVRERMCVGERVCVGERESLCVRVCERE